MSFISKLIEKKILEKSLRNYNTDYLKYLI